VLGASAPAWLPESKEKKRDADGFSFDVGAKCNIV